MQSIQVDVKYTAGCNGTSKALAKGRALNLLLLTRINIKKKKVANQKNENEKHLQNCTLLTPLGNPPPFFFLFSTAQGECIHQQNCLLFYVAYWAV